MKWMMGAILAVFVTVLWCGSGMAQSVYLYGNNGEYLGKVNQNPYDPDSICNPYGRYGSKYSSKSINNPYGRYGNPYSSESATNPYATQAPRMFGKTPDRKESTYLGRLSRNPYAAESSSNPYGRYGSEYSSESIHNPYSTWGQAARRGGYITGDMSEEKQDSSCGSHLFRFGSEKNDTPGFSGSGSTGYMNSWNTSKRKRDDGFTKGFGTGIGHISSFGSPTRDRDSGSNSYDYGSSFGLKNFGLEEDKPKSSWDCLNGFGDDDY